MNWVGLAMFSIRQKREIAKKVEQILRETGHPELPKNGPIVFHLHVEGEDSTQSWANIKNNASVVDPVPNLWNEIQD